MDSRSNSNYIKRTHIKEILKENEHLKQEVAHMKENIVEEKAK